MPKFDHILLVISLLLVAYSYGIASVTWKLFPYQHIQRGSLAIKAWREVLFEPEGSYAATLPVGVKRMSKEIPKSRVETPGATGSSSDDGVILMTGGPFQLMDHCPEHGCMAWLMTRDGTILHSWRFDPVALWPDTSMFLFSGQVEPSKFYPIGLTMFENGDLVVSFQAFNVYPYGIGIAKLDRDSNVLWSHPDYSHHWLTADAEGRIYAPSLNTLEGSHEIGDTRKDLECDKIGWYEDVIRVLSPQGETLREYPLLELLAQSDYAGQIAATVNPCDPTHLNSIELVSGQLANTVDGFAAGDLLVSMRELNMVALLDKDSGAVKHAVAGRTVAQHSPQFLPDGQVLVFDNQGGAKDLGGSRVVQVDLLSGDFEVVFPKPDDERWLPFYTETAGHIDVAEDGSRALVSSSDQGTVLEIDVDSGEVLWVYRNWHDITDYLKDNEIDSDSQAALFATYGAYYVEPPSFLQQ